MNPVKCERQKFILFIDIIIYLEVLKNTSTSTQLNIKI